MFERYQLVFRSSPGGGAVYYGQPAGLDVLQLYDEETPFSFAPKSTDPYFDNYTEMDITRTRGAAMAAPPLAGAAIPPGSEY